ncbi:MAG: glycosyltransferase family 4 protein [Candidatus Omnitrophica bacterium]|nr:glycosyltransferase family 4 protein [Candidatus Omnitrophota bacterium]
MRIAINARSILLANRTGIGRYTYHLLNSFGQIDQQNEYWLYARKNFFDRKRRWPQFSYPHFKVRADVLGLGPDRCLKGVDIYHAPSPEALTIHGPKIVVTIHDLIYKIHPETHTLETIEATSRQMEGIIKFADRIICVSGSTRRDLHRFFGLPQEKSCMIYNGVDHSVFYPLQPDERRAAMDRLRGLGIKTPYLLYVGTIEPRKNLTGLLKSFALLKSKKDFAGQLVVAGMKGWMMAAVAPMIKELGLRDEVIFTGFVSDAQLRELYNLAEAFVFPSLYEGFGFPIVEAFCCGTPVVTSNTSSCAEIAGGCALTVDPRQVPQIAQAIQRLLEDRVFNQELRQKAIKKAQEFSFLKTAQETLKVYEQLAPLKERAHA